MPHTENLYQLQGKAMGKRHILEILYYPPLHPPPSFNFTNKLLSSIERQNLAFSYWGFSITFLVMFVA